VIGVIARADQQQVVEEFFELFKTPWEIHRSGRHYAVVIATVDDVPEVDADLLLHFSQGTASYNLFDEVRRLLTDGQPPEHAHIPALDLHIAKLRDQILNAGIPLVEILPSPSGHPFIACLTHDIDFIGIRNHRFDHTMWGFLYRSTIVAARNLIGRKISLVRAWKTWRAAASLPFVLLGWAKDFWEPFSWYLKVERGLPATYFLIPFRGRAGERVTGAHASRRAAGYCVSDIPETTIATLLEAGCEIGVHGIDAWHSVEKGQEELARVAAVSKQPTTGIRMHWLLRDADTPGVLEQAGYAYDSTSGFNDTIGYRSGTAQVFRPIGARALLELPVAIQDGALFYPQRLNLSEAAAEQRCAELIETTARIGGTLALIWHDRSHGPERFWGDFYIRLIDRLRSAGAWFATASQAVDWFQKRRDVRFDFARAPRGCQPCLRYNGDEVHPPLTIRVHHSSSRFSDTPWNGISAPSIELPVLAPSVVEGCV